MSDGIKIRKHIRSVTADVVVRTGLFSDIAAGFSNLFRGRSKSYQNQFRHIENEVINYLIEEAKFLGANCILGLSLDFDEISGKTKQMFMVRGT